MAVLLKGSTRIYKNVTYFVILFKQGGHAINPAMHAGSCWTGINRVNTGRLTLLPKFLFFLYHIVFDWCKFR